MIHFKTSLHKIGKWNIIKIPQHVSAILPSRGQVMVKGTIQNYDIEQVLEPDGVGGHWLKIDQKLQKALNLVVGSNVSVAIEPIKEWLEPSKPKDFLKALNEAPHTVQDLWDDITPMARWEWVRWINATNEINTRNRRIEVSISKMNAGKRRPCCFNLSSCTDPDLSRSGKLIDL